MNKLEIIVESLEDAEAAYQGGCTQLDIKAYSACGGLTPTIGTIKTICKHIDIQKIMMIRPTARSFVPTDGDIEIACADIQAAIELGINDFMLGFLTGNGELNVQAIQTIRKEAKGCRLHSHLAWELTNDPWMALHQLMDLGFSSIRTSGLSTIESTMGGSAPDAIENILKIKVILEDRMEIFPASNINVKNAGSLIRATGITNLHCGRGARTPGSYMSAVDINKVKALRSAQLSAL